jgi:hypothetical protein
MKKKIMSVLNSKILSGLLVACICMSFGWHFFMIQSFVDHHLKNQYGHPMNSSLMEFYKVRQRELVLNLGQLFFSESDSFDDGLDEMRIYIDAESIQELNSSLPASGEDYKNIEFTYNGKDFDGEFRYRGTNSYHWDFKKKSFKVKIDRGDINGYESLSFSNIKGMPIIPEYLGNEIGEDMGLLTADFEYVKVYINDRYAGLFMYMEDVEEKEFLENHDLEDGDIYRAENLNDQRIPLISSNVFEFPYAWEKVVENEDGLYPNKENVVYFLKVVRDTLEEDIEVSELYDFVDREYFVKFASFISTIQTIHMDFFHNIAFYHNFDNGLFYEIPMDVAGLSEFFGLHIVSNDLLIALHKDPSFVTDKNRLLYDLFGEQGYANEIIFMIDEQTEELAEAIEKDPYKAHIVLGLRTPYMGNEYEELLATGKERIKGYDEMVLLLEQNEGTYITNNNGDTQTLIISSENWAGFEFTDVVLDGDCEALIYRDVNRNQEIDALDELIVGDLQEELHAGLYYNIEPTFHFEYDPILEPDALHYYYMAKSSCPIVGVEGKNLVSQEKMVLEKMESLNSESTFSSHPWN